MKKVLILILLFAAIKSEAQSSLFTKDTLAVNPVFRQRVKSATIIAANQLAADGGWISSMTYQVTSNPVITYDSPDDAIQFTVNSNMEKCARAAGNILPQTPAADSTGILNGIRRN